MSRGTGLIVVVVMVLSTACGGGAGDGSDPSASQPPASSSPTSEDTGFAIPVPSVPPVPEDPTAAQGARFARYFLTQELPYLVNSGFTTQYRRRTSLNCTGCRDVLAEVEKWHADGAPALEPPEVTVVRAQRLAAYSSDWFTVFRVRVVARFPRLELAGDDARVIRGRPQPHLFIVAANRRLGWQVEQWGVPRPKDDGSRLV